MNWFDVDGKELAELIYSNLLERKFLSRNDIYDIIDSNPNYGFRKTLYYASLYLRKYPDIEHDISGDKKLIEGTH
jgi:hypothetical protein